MLVIFDRSAAVAKVLLPASNVIATVQWSADFHNVVCIANSSPDPSKPDPLYPDTRRRWTPMRLSQRKLPRRRMLVAQSARPNEGRYRRNGRLRSAPRLLGCLQVKPADRRAAMAAAERGTDKSGDTRRHERETHRQLPAAVQKTEAAQPFAWRMSMSVKLEALFVGAVLWAGGAPFCNAFAAETVDGCKVDQAGAQKIWSCPGGLTIIEENGARFTLDDRDHDGNVDVVRLWGKALLLDMVAGSGRELEVVTPQAITAVRGTKWAVDVAGAKTSVFVV